MKKQILALAAVAALAAGPALAATVIQNHTIAAGNAPTSTAFSFAQFDSSLGTLNSVTLSFNAWVNTNGSLSNTSNGEHTFVLSQNALASLTGGGFDLDAALLSGTSNYKLIGNKKPGYTPAAIGLNGAGSDSDTLSSGMDAFIGAGEVDFLFSRVANFSVNPGSGALNLTSSLWGDATLTYDYTAAPISSPVGAVPEPATWAMLILGFFSLGSVLRRRRHDGAALAAA